MMVLFDAKHNCDRGVYAERSMRRNARERFATSAAASLIGTAQALNEQVTIFSRLLCQIIDPVLSTPGRVPFDGIANANLTRGSESPVNAFPPNEQGFHDLTGNAWEW